jgi:hypothetical protein
MFIKYKNLVLLDYVLLYYLINSSDFGVLEIFVVNQIKRHSYLQIPYSNLYAFTPFVAFVLLIIRFR